MGFQKIDYAAWPRRPYFEHYHRDVPCWYSMTVDVDISALLPRLRGSGLRFYPSVIHGISRMVNADPALRMAMDETGAIGVYDRVDPTYTIFHKDDETFSVLWTAYQPDLRAFCQDWEADRTRYGDIHTFEARPPEAGQGLFNISAVPWASFRSLHLELPEANDYLLPIFTLGRYRKENGRTLLPLAGLTGAVFLVWMDVLCRVVLPGNEIPIGILTALVGAPVFLALLARRRYGFGGEV